MYSGFGAYTDEGERLGEIAVGNEGYGREGGYSAVRIMRSGLHEILLDGCEQQKGLIEVKFG